MEKAFENAVNKIFLTALRENDARLKQLEGYEFINCGGGVAGECCVVTFRFADGK